MRNLPLLLIAPTLVWSGAALADHFTAICECGKADPQYLLPAGDRSDHSLGVEAEKCTWPKPLRIRGDRAKASVATDTVDMAGGRIHIRGVHELTMQSGDKVALPYRGNGINKDNHSHANGTFTFSDGTGKLKGIKGKGTFSCNSVGKRERCDVEGDYELAR